METIIGIEIFPIISFLIFFIFFISLFVWVAKIKKSEIDMLAELPLIDSEEDNQNINSKTNQ